MANYASASHKLNWNGLKISEGYRGSNFSKNGDLQEVTFDLKGRMHVSQLANQGGIIAVTYQQGCESLKKIDGAASTVQLVGEYFALPFQGVFMFDDPIQAGSFVAWNAVIINTGDIDNAEVIGERTVTWHCEKLIMTDDPINVATNIAQYLGDD